MTQEKHPSKSMAKDVFSYLLMIIMLYVGVLGFIAMLWQYINVSFPDPLEFYYGEATAIIRKSISALLIVWPVFLLLSWLIVKNIRKFEEKRDIWIRKWLLYLTLFIAALTIIIDLISLTNSFLGGELTTRFVLKVLVILAVAVAIFWYYLWDLRRDATKTTKIPKTAAIVSSAIILMSIIAGFFIVGTPSEQRAIRIDEERIADLQSIQGQILNHWIQKDRLPETLDNLKDPLYGYEAPVDPITGEPYEYNVKGDLDFELCATFSSDSPSSAIREQFYPSPVGHPYRKPSKETWAHGEGRVCFERSIDPELYRQDRQIDR
ncbi:hypothetical protein IH979_01345 [Patescibacteria group bacterium]|nr:hypothetical protein [Patescibacteria group bacterium]